MIVLHAIFRGGSIHEFDVGLQTSIESPRACMYRLIDIPQMTRIVDVILSAFCARPLRIITIGAETSFAITMWLTGDNGAFLVDLLTIIVLKMYIASTAVPVLQSTIYTVTWFLCRVICQTVSQCGK